MAVTKRGEERRQTILQRTITIMADRGIESTRLQDVAKAAGISIGTIQHYFASREELIDTALSTYTLQTVDRIWSAVPEDEPDDWLALISLLHSYRSSGDMKERARIWISLSNSAMTNTHHRTLLESLYFQWSRPFLRVLRRGTRSGRFHPILPVEACTDVLLRLTDGYAMAEATTTGEALALGHDLSDLPAVVGMPADADLTERVLVRLSAALVGIDQSA
jgi:AcrR family transcriptional regulator